jgi:Ca2+-binding RTX toxin-like protein
VAFITTPGAAGTDSIKFEGTAGVDALYALNQTGKITAEGLAGDDTIFIANSTGLVGTTTVIGGDGKDNIAFQDAAGANVARISNSEVRGSKGDDTITTVGAESSKIKGNDQDDNFSLSGNYSNSVVAGNADEDSFFIATTTANVTQTDGSVVTTTTGSITLSETKIVGGKGEDGEMTFTAGQGIIAAVNSTINGNDGDDAIQIGNVGSASGFTVFGGKGNDFITSSNAGADTVIYSGDIGDDQITTGAAKDSVLGGEGVDRINAGGDKDTIDAGAGNDIVTDNTGDDTVALGEGNDRYIDGAGSDSITGGLGADTFTLDATATDDNNYIIGAKADSNAVTSGTTRDFDTFGSGFTALIQHIDITSVAESLLGDAVSSSTNVATTRASGVVAGTTAANRVVARFSQASGIIDSGTEGTAFTAGTVLTNVAQIEGVTVTDANIDALNAVLDTLDAAATAAGDNYYVTAGDAANVAEDDVVYFDGDGNFIASTRTSAAGVVDADNAGNVIATGDVYEVNTARRFVDAGELAALTAGGNDVVNALSYNAANTRVTSETTIAASAVTNFVAADDVDSFADLAVALGDNVLTASGSAQGSNVNYNVVTINDGGATNIDGTYIIVNNTNTILDSGDLMFRLTGAGATTTATAAVNLGSEINQYGIFDSSEASSAWII